MCYIYVGVVSKFLKAFFICFMLSSSSVSKVYFCFLIFIPKSINFLGLSLVAFLSVYRFDFFIDFYFSLACDWTKLQYFPNKSMSYSGFSTLFLVVFLQRTEVRSLFLNYVFLVTYSNRLQVPFCLSASLACCHYWVPIVYTMMLEQTLPLLNKAFAFDIFVGVMACWFEPKLFNILWLLIGEIASLNVAALITDRSDCCYTLSYSSANLLLCPGLIGFYSFSFIFLKPAIDIRCCFCDVFGFPMIIKGFAYFASKSTNLSPQAVLQWWLLMGTEIL